MPESLKKFLNEPNDSVVLFFIRYNRVFPIVVEQCSLIESRVQAEKFERMTNAVYSGRLTSVKQYNICVESGENPNKIVRDNILGSEERFTKVHDLEEFAVYAIESE